MKTTKPNPPTTFRLSEEARTKLAKLSGHYTMTDGKQVGRSETMERIITDAYSRLDRKRL